MHVVRSDERGPKRFESLALGVLLTIALVSWGAYFIIINQPSSSTASTSKTATVLSKRDEVVAAKHAAATALKVHRNPDRWQGTYVRFPCRIINGIVGGVDGNRAANAMCGAGVTAKDAPDQVLVVLVGSKVGSLDGGHVVTITGQVLGSVERTNGIGATVDYATIRVDYAE